MSHSKQPINFPVLNVGDIGVGNYSSFESDGTYVAIGDATTWKDINLGAATLSGPPGLRPATTEYLDNTGTGTNIYSLGFDIGEQIGGQFELQHDYAEGTDVSLHLHWQVTTTAPTGTDNVKWQAEWTLAKSGETLSPTTTIVVEAAVDTQYEFKFSAFPTIAGTSFEIGDQFLFTLTRIAASADDYAGLINVATVGIHYQVNTLGSREMVVE